MTVIGIIGVLAGIAFAAVDPIEQFRKAQDNRRKSDLAQLQRALEAYYQDFGHYPTFTGCCGESPGEVGYTINTGTGNPDDAVLWGTTWAPYMDILPIDPNESKFYLYVTPDNETPQSYRVYTSLDRGGNDSDVCNGGAACSNAPGGCGTSDPAPLCNYGITSPNVSP